MNRFCPKGQASEAKILDATRIKKHNQPVASHWCLPTWHIQWTLSVLWELCSHLQPSSIYPTCMLELKVQYVLEDLGLLHGGTLPNWSPSNTKQRCWTIAELEVTDLKHWKIMQDCTVWCPSLWEIMMKTVLQVHIRTHNTTVPERYVSDGLSEVKVLRWNTIAITQGHPHDHQQSHSMRIRQSDPCRIQTMPFSQHMRQEFQVSSQESTFPTSATENTAHKLWQQKSQQNVAGQGSNDQWWPFHIENSSSSSPKQPTQLVWPSADRILANVWLLTVIR